MKAFQIYEQICCIAWNDKRKSHIHTRIIPAVQGVFGDFQMYSEIEANVTAASKTPPFINPLMGIYWFFNLNHVVQQNLYAPIIDISKTFIDAKMMLRQNIVQQTRRKEIIPL